MKHKVLFEHFQIFVLLSYGQLHLYFDHLDAKQVSLLSSLFLNKLERLEQLWLSGRVFENK
jgi:hypothetical protein